MNKNSKSNITFDILINRNNIHASTRAGFKLPVNGVLTPEEDPLYFSVCVTRVLAPCVFSPLPVVKGLKTWDSSQVDV